LQTLQCVDGMYRPLCKKSVRPRGMPLVARMAALLAEEEPMASSRVQVFAEKCMPLLDAVLVSLQLVARGGWLLEREECRTSARCRSCWARATSAPRCPSVRSVQCSAAEFMVSATVRRLVLRLVPSVRSVQCSAAEFMVSATQRGHQGTGNLRIPLPFSPFSGV
jgi:hypothetical protein